MSSFWNRENELSLLSKNLGKGVFGFVTGRRRVGKTELLLHATHLHRGLYHQAIEGTSANQIEHLTAEWQQEIPIFRDVKPRSWTEVFRILTDQSLPKLLVFDEFPYLVESDSSLPSILQKWVDHVLPEKKTLLMISGSSQSMLYSEFLSEEAPLYGRAKLHIALSPLSFDWFCRIKRYDLLDPLAFERFSLVGGVPHYWKMMDKTSLIQQAQALYFDNGALLSGEPRIILQDEGITGGIPKAILDLVGRGCCKPGEIAARLGIPQGNLSRPLQSLLELGFLYRELPFGESLRSTKKVFYAIEDESLNFYYGTLLSHRHAWPSLTSAQKKILLHEHAARQWEKFCRKAYHASRYWESNLEIDLVAKLPASEGYLIAECKWKALKPSEEEKILKNLKEKFTRSGLSSFKKVQFKVLSFRDLKSVSQRER